MAQRLHSIQGFEQGKVDEATFMSDGDLDAYIATASDEILICRERGRHLYPTARKAGVRFTAMTDDGMLVRQVWCESCGLAERREFWQTRGRGTSLRYERVDSKTVYHQGSHGERYLAPAGQGRMSSKRVQGAIVSQALSGQSLASVKAAAKAYKDDNEKVEHKKQA